MRFFGPRSISSLMKTALDIVFYGLCGMITVLVIGLLALLSVPTLAIGVIDRLDHLFMQANSINTTTVALVLLAYGLSLAGYLMVTYWTRSVFLTLVEGKVFHCDNVSRLRFIGYGLAGLELFGYAATMIGEALMGLRFDQTYGLRAVTTWFSVLVVFVLAEVFKEGARLQGEAELTV